MWVLVAKLKKQGNAMQEQMTNDSRNVDEDPTSVPRFSVVEKDAIPHSDIPKEEPLVVRLKARMQEMKYTVNGDPNSHACKDCFESASAAMLLPCRHFCFKLEKICLSGS